MTSAPAALAGVAAGQRPARAPSIVRGPARSLPRAAIEAFRTVRDALAVLAWLAGMIIRPPVSPAGRDARRKR